MDDNSSAETKEKFSKILVAADGSEASMDAADYAIEIARNMIRTNRIIHVILSDITILDPNLPPHIIEIRQQAQQHLDKIKQKLSDQGCDDKIHMRTEIISSATTAGGHS
jgi:nucleotide-binding universal stress UspA family protein